MNRIIRVIIVGSLRAAEAHIDDSDWWCDEVGILRDPVQTGDQVFIRSGGPFYRVRLENIYTIQRRVRCNTDDVDIVISSSDNAADVGPVTMEVLARTAERIERIDALNLRYEGQVLMIEIQTRVHNR